MFNAILFEPSLKRNSVPVPGGPEKSTPLGGLTEKFLKSYGGEKKYFFHICERWKIKSYLGIQEGKYDHLL
jgi:hypothetical protein